MTTVVLDTRDLSVEDRLEARYEAFTSSTVLYQIDAVTVFYDRLAPQKRNAQRR